MAHEKDGGPAFPLHPGIALPEQDGDPRWLGMSIRDWFAGQALIGIAIGIDGERVAELAEGIRAGAPWAKAAYVLADAMLAERAK